MTHNDKNPLDGLPFDPNNVIVTQEFIDRVGILIESHVKARCAQATWAGAFVGAFDDVIIDDIITIDDDEAVALGKQFEMFKAGFERTIPKEFVPFVKEYIRDRVIESDPDYKKYLELKEKYKNI